MTQLSDKTLFLKIKEGDEAAFNKAFESYYSRLCFFADNIIHDYDQSSSIVQQVFVDLWLKRERLDVVYSLKGFLFRSVRNQSLDWLRHRKVESEYLQELSFKQEEAVFLDQLELAELNDKINTAIQELPEKCREIFVLCRFEGLKYAEIASRLEISVKTVETQMSIALKKIRTKVSDSQYLNLLTFIFSKKN
ncbi:RNA polymerase sigma-70 factor [Sunxiuqinia elliptica]|uniref:RNA polymerase sigma-70 factor (ECF subfamily) n=1 Tax=Sunxiuqinia elliptica TaxID=655355 RepID=A0A4R6HCN0_9BACT|nr:RNA polymerase sigma-70 factor [Sunxiuqinia elliptica]TDO05536.1 RNA polymerase sigma-70 factor (ECF subfamily) [Sunxiuqinia elliptica]TDO65080.1 RNA polymerase sigma-70 factor (ECF subfamily) [Sunxiuqinia elliptica]